VTIEITDEMVRTAKAASRDHYLREVEAQRYPVLTSECMRAALAAVAPMMLAALQIKAGAPPGDEP
jgi:hypothetical protein